MRNEADDDVLKVLSNRKKIKKQNEELYKQK